MTDRETSRRGPRAGALALPLLAGCVLATTTLGGSASAAPTLTADTGVEVVKNGGFEVDTTGWNIGRSVDETLTRVAGGQFSGFSAQLTNTGATTKTVLLNDAANTVASTVAGGTYRAAAWVRASAPNQSIGIRLMEFRGSSTLAKQAQASVWVTDTAWHPISVVYTAAENGNNIDLNVLGYSTPARGSVFVDGVSLKAPGTPPGIQPAAGTGALFGYYQAGNADVAPMEASIGRSFDAVHRYYDFNGNNSFPSAADNALSASGHIIHIGWEMQTYNGSYNPAIQPAPAATATAPGGAVRKAWTYDQILSGSLNTYVDGVASRLAASPYKYVIDFQHEVDDTPDVGGSNPLRAASGSRQQFAATYRYLVDRFRAHGVTNVTWAWTMSGWYASDTSKWWSYQQLWPGKGYVDVIMWDPYNHSASNWKSFTTIVNGFYKPLKAGMLDAVDPSAKLLPTGLAEYGCMPDPRRPAWLTSVPTELRAFPDMVYLNYFSSGSWASLQGDATSISAFGAEGSDPWLRTRA